jgi:cobalamin-dependent methionine synthase I
MRRERGEREEFKTNARRDALRHPTMVATKNLIAEITAEAMAEEWISEVRGELPVNVRAKLEQRLHNKNRQALDDGYGHSGYANGYPEYEDIPGKGYRR